MPPLHTPVVVLQIGHGWSVGSSWHVPPPGQRGFGAIGSSGPPQRRPGLEPPLQRRGRMSPVRYASPRIGSVTRTSPVSQRAVPRASSVYIGYTQTLCGWFGFGTTSGGPNGQPFCEQLFAPLLAADDGPRISVSSLQQSTLRVVGSSMSVTTK